MAIVVVVMIAAWVWFAVSEVRHVLRRDSIHPTRLTALAHNPLITREVTGPRLALLGVAGLGAWVGACFILGWVLVRYPVRRVPPAFIPDQPTPDWLWQTGVVLVGVGIAATFALLLTAPHLGHKPIHVMSRRASLVMCATMALGCWLPLVIALYATRYNQHGDAALFVVMLPLAILLAGWWSYQGRW